VYTQVRVLFLLVLLRRIGERNCFFTTSEGPLHRHCATATVGSQATAKEKAVSRLTALNIFDWNLSLS
jgi:hypothetical protein